MKQFHLHLVSDATGETINSVARACVAQFDDVRPVEHFWNLVRTERQLALVIDGIRDNPGLVMFTLVDDGLRRQLQDVCHELAVPCIPVLDPLITALAAYLGLESSRQPGRQHALDAEYFGRMDAMDFALAHDDGQGAVDLHQADVVLVGVSRTSKTPTCIYLANRGIKAANIPFVPGCPLPEELNHLTRPLIVGLTKDPDRLIQIRRNRLRLLNQGEETSYVDPEYVRAEVAEARRILVNGLAKTGAESAEAEGLSLGELSTRAERCLADLAEQAEVRADLERRRSDALEQAEAARHRLADLDATLGSPDTGRWEVDR